MSDLTKAVGRVVGHRTGPPSDKVKPPAFWTKVVTWVLLGIGVVLAVLIHGKHSTFQPKQGFVLLAGFYVAAQSVERLLEIVLPAGAGTAQAKAERVLVIGGLAFVLGIAASLALGLRFLSAVQVTSPPRWLDVVVTGLVISGGTKPLHDLIGVIEKAKTG